jgi:hypothetical protein
MGASYPSRPARSSSGPLHAVCGSNVGRRPVLRSAQPCPSPVPDYMDRKARTRHYMIPHAAGLEARARNRPGCSNSDLKETAHDRRRTSAPPV